ncbi:MAG: hypothetical protein ACXWVQ_07170 [Methyloceanibacter sp.]
MARLFFASLVTFGILIGMVVGLVLAAMVATGEVDFTVAIALTIVINLLIWLVSPWLSDLTLRWFNSLEFLDDATVRERYPGIHQLIHQVADDYRFTAHGSASFPTAIRPPSLMACCARMRASW